MTQIFVLLCILSFNVLYAQKFSNNKCNIKVTYSPGEACNRFIPSQKIGAAFDGHGKGDINRILNEQNIAAMRSMGFGPIAYRLRTELGAETWHWNPNGTWSEPGKQQGYWVSDTSYKGNIQISNGYQLPRRGNSHDQANDDGYSMVDDGDSDTFWKSNPYLDSAFTHESNSLHPQWMVVDLGGSFPVNAIKVDWAQPFATSYKVDYALDIGKDYFDPLQPDLWHEFSKGNIGGQDGKSRIILVSDSIKKIRFVRITMTESSGTALSRSNDIRDRLGFAVREIEVGLFEDEKFHDYVRHAADNEKQSVIHVSSTDPWHRAIDLDVNTEQAGIDKFFTSGLVQQQAVLMPMAVLYDNPENMIALVQYVRSRKYNVKEFEIGEEPEGQLIDPQDYAALYCEWSDAVKRIDTSIRFGGPGFASLATTPEDAYSFTEQKWTKIFLSYLSDHHRLGNFNFFSFEWYPFDDVCAPTAPQLAANPALMKNALNDLQKTILPPHTPIYITEYGYSAHSGRAQVDIEGALMYADILGKSLTLGVDKAFLYGYEPTSLDVYNNCSWGNNMLFDLSAEGKIIFHTAAYYGMKMLMNFWITPHDSMLEIYPSHSNTKNQQGEELITSYAVHSPQGKWSLILINKDPRKTWNADVQIMNSEMNTDSSIHFPLTLLQYSRKQYRWKANGPRGHPVRELPPLEKELDTKNAITLPPYSLSVIREN